MHTDLLAPDPTFLPEELDRDPRAELSAGTDPSEVARRHPAASLVWAVLAEGAADPVTSYAFARTGYHRGLDALRRAGWRGSGPVPISHVPNQGFLRAVLALAEAAEAIGEVDEHTRCVDLLRMCGTGVDEVAALRG